MFSHLKKEAKEKWKDVDICIPIGGFIFLRFICPALTSPHIYGLVEFPPSSENQRMLILISKVLQNLATLRPFKEDYMLPMNEFIDINKKSLEEFYHNISELPTNRTFVPPIKVPKDVLHGALTNLREYISKPEILSKLKELFQHHQNTYIKEYLKDLSEMTQDIPVIVKQ